MAKLFRQQQQQVRISLCKVPDAALKQKNIPLFIALFRRTVLLNRS